MNKSIYDLALETVNPDGGELTENQENEVGALVQFGKRVLENSRLPTQLAPDVAKPRRRMVACPECETMFGVELS